MAAKIFSSTSSWRHATASKGAVRFATGGLLVALGLTGLQWLSRPVTSSAAYWAGILFSATIALLPSFVSIDSHPGLAIWKFFPGPWRLRPVKKFGTASQTRPEGGSQSCGTDIQGPLDFGPTENSIVIIGSGLAGLSTALALRKVGIPAIVLEREKGPRQEGSAITMWPNAFRVFDVLGVGDAIREDHPPVTGVVVGTNDGSVLRSFGLDECPGGPHDARIVRRNAILRAMEAQLPPDCIKYSVSVAAVRTSFEGAEVELADGRLIRCRAVVGCDGVRSGIAQSLGLPPALYAGEVYYRGLATFPEGVPEPPGTLRMMWGRGTTRLGISTLSRNQCFWFITKSCPEEEHFETDEERRQDALACVKGWGCHIEDAIRNTPPELLSRNRIFDRWLTPGDTVGKGCITVAGDAFHPMTPTLGQGGGTALEDGVCLARVLQKAGRGPAPLEALTPCQLTAALREYEKERSARVGPITKQSYIIAWRLQVPYAWACFLQRKLMKHSYPVTNFLLPANFFPEQLKPDDGLVAEE